LKVGINAVGICHLHKKGDGRVEWEKIIQNYICSPCKVGVLGATVETGRPVSGVMSYLMLQGFKLYPINPKYVGLKIFGLDFYATIRDVPDVLDIISVFISPQNQAFLLGDLENLTYKPIVWMQPGAENPELEGRLKALGYSVVSGQCLMAIHKLHCGKSRRRP